MNDFDNEIEETLNNWIEDLLNEKKRSEEKNFRIKHKWKKCNFYTKKGMTKVNKGNKNMFKVSFAGRHNKENKQRGK